MLYGRPELNKELGSKRFKEFYYLETELIEFCKANSLDYDGDKNELTERICAFMNGKQPEPKFIIKPPTEENAEDIITEDTFIEDDFEFSEKHSEFFKRVIGLEFYMNDIFWDWLVTHPGRTFGDAVDMWYLFEEE